MALLSDVAPIRGSEGLEAGVELENGIVPPTGKEKETRESRVERMKEEDANI